MNITPKLNLNRHPKDATNLSFVNAHNVKVANDESCTTTEESIRENAFIHTFLVAYYGSLITYRIVGVIPCNNELVIIVKPSDTIKDSDIFRYQESVNNNIEKMYCAYGGIASLNRFKYSGGLIKGACTYNVENSLIIAITEYNVPNLKIPLRTINLGNIDNSDVYNDKNLSDAKLSISPEVRIPKVINLEYLSGSAYKGWYYIFIRYKINTVDYTQWYSIGSPIYIDSLEQYQIIRYCFNRETKLASTPLFNIVAPSMPDDGFGVGCSDYFSNTSDIAKETFKIDLIFDNNIDYTKYQIGVICASKSYNKGFKTSDISLDNTIDPITEDIKRQYVLDNKSLSEYAINNFINDNFNYFNTKNIINYQNRLYVSNYIEDNANNNDIDESIINDVNLNLIKSGVSDYGLVYDTALIGGTNTVNQYDTYSSTVIPLHIYLNISEETLVTITGAGYPAKSAKSGQFYITSNKLNPAFAYIELREPGPLSSVIVTNYGKEPNQTTLYLTLPNVNGGTETTIILDTSKIAINGGMRYINTNISFDERKKESSLIPGEVYNFLIHFTNKYGHSTNGYKLQNKTIWDTEDDIGVEIIPIPFNIKIGNDFFIFYGAVPVNTNVAIEDFTTINKYNINTNNIKYYKQFSGSRLIDKCSPIDDILASIAFIDYFSSYANIKHLTTKWYQISYGPDTNQFHLFINNNGDRLFKMPMVESFNLVWDGFPDEVEDFKTHNLHTTLKIGVSNVQIPEGYDGYYISYEKFEPQARATGLLTRNDFRSQDYMVVDAIITESATANTHKSDKMFFYSSSYDISDTIKLDYNIMRVEAVNCFKKQDIPEWDYFQRNYGFNFVHDMNKPQVDTYGGNIQKTYDIPDYKIVVADSAADNRMGLGTALQLKDSYNLFHNYDTNSTEKNKIKLYRVTVLNTTRDIYMSNNKNVIRLTDVMYRDNNRPIDYKYSISYVRFGYNGYYTYDGIPIYENSGLAFNTTTNKATRFMNNSEYYQSIVSNEKPHTFQNDIPFLAYLQLPICTDIFFESKSFKKAPVGIVYVVKKVGEGDAARNLFAKGSMVTPVNTIDLFENRQGSSDQFNAKTYANYREDLVSIEQFNKTLRRSNVIQDETRINGWRTFPIEAYKNITENKGKITNLIGVGTVLLVHTEHSLFMFDTNNTLKTQDKDIQLVQPDAFAISYKEVFTSDKGYGGLQDDKSFTIDQFGYIFYSNDTNRIYRFDDKQLDNIDEDIIQWLAKYKPFNVRMANDKENYRILMKFDYIVGGILKHTVLSYNYKVKYFVCQHDYYFDEAYNTKIGLYLQCNNDHIGCSLHNFTYNGPVYGSYDNILGSLGTIVVRPSTISIICNNNFDIVKFLEFISYKLTKYVNDANIDFTNSPVEEYIVPFAGNSIVVYNNMTNTGVLDINVNTEITKNVFAEFDKPYWDLGVWNFSYLRNKINQLPAGLSATEMSRIFGNYFIIEFTFNNLDGHRVDFEELNYNLSEN